MESPARRAPSQHRSRLRVENILSAARELIGEVGSDALRMADVAERAGTSIGSLYQYFPDKSAIVRSLAERYNILGRACIAEKLRDVHSQRALRTAFSDLLDVYYALFWAEPVMRDIWSAMQADKELRAFKLAESRRNGALLAAAMLRVKPGADRQQLENAAFLIMQLGEATMRLALSIGRREGDALVAAYKRMALGELSRRD